MNVVRVVESTESIVELPDSEATALEKLGQQLASKTGWWGAPSSVHERSVIRVLQSGVGKYRIAFRDVVGVARIGNTQFEVIPKIPFEHFRFIAEQSEIAPRSADSQISVSSAPDLIRLICRWMINAAEKLLRIGMRKDYSERIEDLSAVRGRILPYETGLDLWSGRPRATCEFDELSFDMPLNRIVKAACTAALSRGLLDEGTARRARLVLQRMSEVGAIRSADRFVVVDRLSAAYTNVVSLARLVLDGCGSSFIFGRLHGSTFLIRTPELVEDGLRSALSAALPDLDVAKKKLMLGKTGLSLNPDLVFCHGAAVGDVKYRFLNSNWNMPDLYQIVAFATAANANKAAIFGFSADSLKIPTPVPVGLVRARAIFWNVQPESVPAESLLKMCQQVRSWLAEGQDDEG